MTPKKAPAKAARKTAAKKTTSRTAARKSATAARRTPVRRRAARIPPPKVSPGQRSSAVHEVAQYLQASNTSAIEQPGALVPFFERVFRLETKASPEPAHILHFGDSHTAADEWTGRLRNLFQEHFGDGGSGFSVAGYPFAGYRRFDARGGATNYWRSEGLRTGAGDGWFGLGGISITAERAGQSVYLNTDTSHVEIQFVRQPGGGQVTFYDNDELREAFSTDGELAPGFVAYDVPPGPHRFLLKTLDSKPVRLLGWVVDKPGGVTYEALGINGAEASVMLRWNPDMLAAYVQRRDPALIVLAYGTNEASDPAWKEPDAYHAMFTSLLQRIRQFAPAASILVVGPGDRWIRTRGGWRTVPGIDAIIAAQRAACRDVGCAFWDTRSRMGGEGAMRNWVYAGLAQADRVHFTSAGYQRLGDTLFSDVMQQYQVFLRVRQQAQQSPPAVNNIQNGTANKNP